MRGSAWNEVDHTVDHISSFYFYALFYYVIYRILIFQMSLLSDWTSIHVLHNIQIQSLNRWLQLLPRKLITWRISSSTAGIS